jgi:ParB family chromosome partitioning protein
MPRLPSQKAEQPYRQLRNTGNILSLYDTSSSKSDKPALHDADILSLGLNDIYVDPQRVRKYFDQQALSSLASSMKAHGFIGTIVVRPNQSELNQSELNQSELNQSELNQSEPNQSETELQSQPYILVAGGRRYAAAKLAGLESLRAIVADLTEEQALEFELIENLQREDLNPIEETRGILQLLSKRLKLEESQVIALFQRYAYLQQNIDIQNNQPDAEFNQHWHTVEQLFAVIGKFTPDSFRANRLPLLNMPEPILDAVSNGQLEYSKARLIARVKDESMQDILLQQAIEQGLTQSQLQETIQQLNQQSASGLETQVQFRQIQTRAAGVAKTLKKPQFLASLSKRDRARVERLLDQLWEITNKSG